MRTLTRTILPFLILLLLGVATISQAATISGSITNTTAKSGRLYVVVDHQTYGSTGYGTSIADVTAGETVAYQLRGVRSGTYVVRAFLDTRGTGFPYGESPIGMLTPVVIPADDATVTGQNFSLADQPQQTLNAPELEAIPLDNGVLLFWDVAPNGYDIEIASHYNVYWSTTPNPGPANTTGGGSKLNIPSHNDGHAFIPLNDGGVYYFAVVAVLSSATNYPLPPSVTAAPVTIGPGISGPTAHTVSLTLNFDAAPGAPLLVVVESDSEQWLGGAYIASPTQTQLITIPGVPDGSYELYLILDKNSNGIYDTGDVNFTELEWRAPLINMAGADINLGSRNMTVSRNLESSLSTERNLQSPWVYYGLNFQFYKQVKRPAHFVVSGTQLTTTDLGVNSWGEFWSYHPVPSAPNVGDEYTVTVTYTDGTTESFDLSVSNVLTVNPTPTHPIGTTAPEGVAPWFSWNSLSGLPNTPILYRMWVQQTNASGDNLFEAILPPDRTSVAYSGDPLQVGTQYSWAIEMVDSQGNRAVSWSSFTPQASGPSISSVSPTTLACGSGSNITITGTGFSATPGQNQIWLNNTQYPITPSSATTTSLTFQLPDCATTPSPVGPVIVKVTGQPSVGSHGEFTPSFTFSGSVVNSSNAGMSGVTVALDATDPLTSITTGAGGTYGLPGIPTGRLYRLKLTYTGMIPLYTANMLHYDDAASSFPYTMFATSSLTTWGVTAGKGIIRARTRDNIGNDLNAVTVSAFSSRYNSNSQYTIKYGASCNSTTPLADSPIFCVLNVEDGDMIKVSGAKTGYSFNYRIFKGVANAMGQSGLTGTPLPQTLPIATAGAAMGFSFDGTNYLVGIENHGTSPTSIAAQVLSASGAQVGSLITTGRSGLATAVAFDGANHLLIWEDDELGDLNGATGWKIYGQFIDRAGVKVGSPFEITTAGIWFDGMRPMAFGGGKYLVTYTRLAIPALGDTSTNRYIGGRIVNPDGSMGSEFQISNGNGQASDVAFDGTNFFVVWTEDQLDTEIRGRFVSPTGTLGTEVSINASVAPSDNPKSVAFDGTNYLVVWNDEIDTEGPQLWDVFGQLVAPNGSLIGSPFTITNETGPQIPTSVAFDGSNYLATWVDLSNDTNGNGTCDADENSCWDIYGQYINTSGVLQGGKITINATAGNQIGGVGFANGKYLALVNNGVVMGENGISEVAGVVGQLLTPLSVPAAPTISSFSPGSGAVGSTVTINGTNFVKGATDVTFNGVASAVTVVNSGQLTAVVPAGATTGNIKVTTAGGSVTSGTGFTVTIPVVNWTLTVSMASATSGTGQVLVSDRTTCGTSPCSYSIADGTNILLIALPHVTSGFSGWTGDSCFSDPPTTCGITMNGDLSITANFSLLQLKNDTKATYHATLLDALTNADSGNLILAHNSLGAPSLSYNRTGVTVTVKGGYNNAFDQRLTTDFTDILYPLIIQAGTLILDQIVVK